MLTPAGDGIMVSFPMTAVQIFGVRNSHATRAAERFFKERRATIQMVDLHRKSTSQAEIRRFIERFGGVANLLDTEGAAYADAGLKYLKLSEAELLQKIEREPKLLKLPLVRSGKYLAIGHDEASWKEMLAQAGGPVSNG